MNDVGTEAVALLHDLVAVDSVNPALVPGAAGEHEIVELLRSRLDGFETTVVPGHGDATRPSLVAVGPGEPHWPTIVLNGHLDTVGVDGMSEPFTPRVEGERLLGRGAADMKGGVAALVVAAETLVASSARVRPVLALVADEEDASIGSESVIAALPSLGVSPTACLIAEPTDLALARSLRGFALARVQFAGRAAHSSQADQGINAVTHLGRFLAAVDAVADGVRVTGGDLMVTRVSGGSSAFVIPEHAECLVEVRTTPEQPTEDLLGLVEDLLRPEWAATIESLTSRPGWRLDSEGPAAAFAESLAARLGTDPTFDAPYWMEAPLWQQVCPTVVCGPSGGGLHAAEEWVSLTQVRRFTTALVDILTTWDPRGD